MPAFTQDNLYFKPIDHSDLANLIILDTDPEVRQFFPDGAQTIPEIEQKISRYQNDFANNGYGIFAVFIGDTNEFVGRAGFGIAENGETEVGYLLLKKFWGKGIATRIVTILLNWAEDNIQRDKIIAYTPTEHIASQRVMEKSGMLYAGIAHFKGTECVVYHFALQKNSAS